MYIILLKKPQQRLLNKVAEAFDVKKIMKERKSWIFVHLYGNFARI